MPVNNHAIDVLNEMLQTIISETLDSLSVWRYGFHLCWRNLYIQTEGGWELLDIELNVIDQQVDWNERRAYELWRLLGLAPVSVRVERSDTIHLHLTFNNGMNLRILGDNTGYEAWAVVYTDKGRPISQVISRGDELIFI